MNLIIRSLFPLFALAAVSAPLAAEDKIPLALELPKALFTGTPVPITGISNLERPRTGSEPALMVAKTATNLAKGKKVTSSDNEPILGDLSMINDGEKAGDDGNYVELGGNKQWVQIDLGAPAALDAVVVWHYHSQARVYKAVVVQLSNDPDFTKGVETIYNNDDKNANGLGVGKDSSYIETNRGRVIDAKGLKARYVRLYSNGNSSNDTNQYIEVEVYGTP